MSNGIRFLVYDTHYLHFKVVMLTPLHLGVNEYWADSVKNYE